MKPADYASVTLHGLAVERLVKRYEELVTRIAQAEAREADLRFQVTQLRELPRQAVNLLTLYRNEHQARRDGSCDCELCQQAIKLAKRYG